MATYIVSFIVFPYVSRVLGAEGVGKIGFVNSVVTYFSLFAFWGIKDVAVREIAACGDDDKSRSEVFSSFVAFLSVSTTVVLLIYLIAVFSVPQLYRYKELLLPGSFFLLFSSFLIDWLYQGMENFKYVTIRTICIRLLYVLFVFLLVRKSDDVVVYYILSVITIILNVCVNWIHSRKYVVFSWNLITVRKYIKPIFFIGLYTIMGSMYTTFNISYLGFVCDDMEVGYYVTAIKLYNIIIGIVSAFTAVMLPKMSSLLSEGNMQEFRAKMTISFEVIVSVAFPVAFFCIALAPEIIQFIAGPGFEGAVFPMRISMIVFILSSLAHVWVIQVLLPLKKDKVILVSSICGAAIGLVLNLAIVGRCGVKGTAIVLLCGEICGNLYGFIYALKHDLIDFPWLKILGTSVISVSYALICLAISHTGMNSFLVLLVSFVCCLAIFLFYHMRIDRNTYISSLISGYLHK